MSEIYTEFLKSLDTDGSLPDETLALDILAQLRKDLKGQLIQRGLWTCAPSILGLPGSSWDADTLEDLIHEGYLYVFSERLKNLKPQLKVRENIDGLVVLNLKHLLTRLQRDADPMGYRVYELLSAALAKAGQAGDIHVVSGGERIRNDTVFAFAADTDPDRAADAASLAELIPAWTADVLPGLITARGRTVTLVIDRIQGYVLALESQGIAAFRFRDVALPLQKEVRGRWGSVWDLDAGEAGTEFNDEGLVEMVRVVQPANYDDGRSFEWLLECVPNSIDQRQDDKTSNREGLSSLWEYVRGLASSLDETRGMLPSFAKLGRLLGIYRERVPVLLKILRGIVEACREREGRISEVRPRNRQAEPALRSRGQRQQAVPAVGAKS